MLFSLSTIAAVAALLSVPTGADAAVLDARGSSSLCTQKNYGASGYPWQVTSSPGSFCGSSKPSNNKLWQSLPYWDGGDTVKCSNLFSRLSLNVCSKSGNKKSGLPTKCNPPHKGRKTTTTAAASTATSKTATVAAASSVVYASSAAASSAVASSAVASSAVASSAAASFAVASSAAVSSAATSSAAASSAVASSAAASSAAASSTTSSAAATSTDVTQTNTTYTDPSVDPLSDPVCESTYQVTYTNYTLVAPNGYWYGQTVGAATQDASYMTYTLATSVDDCLAACDQIEGCVFVNTYYDENDTETYLPKHTPGVLTCAMYSQCVGTASNTNWGGQDDPNIIVDSNGYCKSGACSS